MLNPLTATGSKLLFHTESLVLSGNTTIASEFVFAHTRGSIRLEEGVNVSSTMQNSCSEAHNWATMFSCVPFKSLQPTISTESFLTAFNHQFNKKHDTI